MSFDYANFFLLSLLLTSGVNETCLFLCSKLLWMENLSALPPGFGFHPTDVELVSHYLKRKTQGHNFDEIIPEVDIYKHEPWDLPGNFVTYPGLLCFYCRLMLSIVDMIVILIFVKNQFLIQKNFELMLPEVDYLANMDHLNFLEGTISN